VQFQKYSVEWLPRTRVSDFRRKSSLWVQKSTKTLQKNSIKIQIHGLLCSDATFIAARCCAHAVDKIAMSVTEMHQTDQSSSAARPLASRLCLESVSFVPQKLATLTSTCCRFRTLKIFVTFCDKDGQHICFVHCMSTTPHSNKHSIGAQ
jgi:hypothetical protein